jgi:RNA polymerase sigma-70 factor (ECF subfamily)
MVEDTELIQNILKGSPQSQKILFNKYKKIVRNFIKNKYSVYYDIDDDVSDIMIKVFMNLGSFDITKSKFIIWVITITKNHMIDKWRNNNINNNTVCLSTLDNNISHSNINIFDNNDDYTSYFTADINFETNNSINYISQQLSAQDYTLLNMKYFRGYDYNEIGLEFNVSSSTICNRVNHIKTKLKKNKSKII